MSKARPRLVAAWVSGYQRPWLAKDVLAGLAAGAVVIPQAMAYATIADLPPQVGLYTCLVPMAVYAVLGGSRALSVSTTSTIAVLTGSTLVAAAVVGSSADPERALASLTVLVGLILLAARVLRLGSLIDNVSEATLTGVKVGVGLTVAAGQLPHLLGIPSDPDADSFVSELIAVVHHLGDVSWGTVAFSAGTIATLLVLRRVAPRVPGPLVAVAAGVLLVRFASLDEHGIALIAPVPSGLPLPVAPTWHGLDALVPGAFAIAIMVFLESLAVARAVRRPEDPPIDNDQELLACAVSNSAGALFRAMPSAGGLSQTAVNQRAGARTQLSELVTVGLAVGCALVLGGVLSDLPQATLASMVVVAVLGLIQPREVVLLWRVSRVEFWVAAATAAAGLTLGLLAAVLVGIVATLFLVIVELDRLGVTELRPLQDRSDLDQRDDLPPIPGLVILRVDGPLYTANVRSVIRKLLAVIDDRPGTRVLVVDASAISETTFTVLTEIADLRREVQARGVELWFAALGPRVCDVAAATPVWAPAVADDRIHPTVLAAVRAFEGEPR